MKNLLFKEWILAEMANYGFDSNLGSKPKGGTEVEDGNTPFRPLDAGVILTELIKMPPIGINTAIQRWNNAVEWGQGPGAIQITASPLGSLKVIARRMVHDLMGEKAWICKYVLPLSDNTHREKEISLAYDLHTKLSEMNMELIDGPDREYPELNRLAWKLWSAARRNHPSYCMFPISLRKQNENYYKLVFEFRGQGVESQHGAGPSRAEQFNIDLYWDQKKGLIKCWGYNIDSPVGQHLWAVQPSEWNEYFSPHQEHDEIIKSVIDIFMQY